jgi:polyhydroxyalkanoate synthase
MQGWLAERSDGMAKPPAMGAARNGYEPIADAPGQYVRQR